MSGTPPLAGFIGKFLLFNLLILLQKYTIILAFSFINIFSIYFYIQNLRFMVSKTQNNSFLISGFYAFFNKKLLNLIVFLNSLNIFSILYFEDLLYLSLNTVFLKNF
jgi:NADH:ubiquinone oxidoreductase subunit 2 (subunit N)